MAKTSSVEKNNRRRRMVAQQDPKRKRLKEAAKDKTKSAEERFAARLLPQAQNVPQPAA